MSTGNPPRCQNFVALVFQVAQVERPVWNGSHKRALNGNEFIFAYRLRRRTTECEIVGQIRSHLLPISCLHCFGKGFYSLCCAHAFVLLLLFFCFSERAIAHTISPG